MASELATPTQQSSQRQANSDIDINSINIHTKNTVGAVGQNPWIPSLHLATLPRSSPGMERSCRSYSLHSRSAITHAPPQVLHNFDRDERHAFPERVYRVHQVAATQQISLCYTIALAILVAACLVATALGVALYLAKGHKRAGMVVYFIGGLATTVAMGGLMASARRSVAEIMTMAILVWTVFPTNFKELVF